MTTQSHHPLKNLVKFTNFNSMSIRRFRDVNLHQQGISIHNLWGLGAYPVTLFYEGSTSPKPQNLIPIPYFPATRISKKTLEAIIPQYPNAPKSLVFLQWLPLQNYSDSYFLLLLLILLPDVILVVFEH